MLDPILNLRIAELGRRRLLEELERTSEARRFEPAKPPGSFPYDLWLARLGVKMKSRPGAPTYGPGLNIG